MSLVVFTTSLFRSSTNLLLILFRSSTKDSSCFVLILYINAKSESKEIQSKFVLLLSFYVNHQAIL